LPLFVLFVSTSQLVADEPVPRSAKTVRVATCQAKNRVIDWHLDQQEAALDAVDKNLDELEKIVHLAGDQKCDVLALPEDTLGLLNWYGMNEQLAKLVLPEAVKRMLDRLGRAAAQHNMYLVVCSDHIETDGATYNTAFFIGRDGKEIGRYHKVCPTWSESGGRQRGCTFPVFDTPDLGTVGLAICYDLVFPETARCLALNGADIVFFPTMGGAAIGDDDIGIQALRVRAAENQVYLVVAFRGSGSMIISPRGKILAKAEGPDGLAVVDIDPRSGRKGGDSSNQQEDMRARLFRERNAQAFSILSDPNPPVMSKLPSMDRSREEAGRMFARMLTVGDEEFKRAVALTKNKEQTHEAIAAFEKLQAEYRGSWIDRVATERLVTLRAQAAVLGLGIASQYPGDAGIEKDPSVLFADNFESGGMNKWDETKGPIAVSEDRPNSGRWCVHVPMHRGKDTGGDAKKWFMPGADKVYARFYVKFSSDYQYNHHFVWLSANQRTNKWSSFGKAGLKPNGTYYSAGMEPWFAWGKNHPPGEVNLYTYYLDMEPDQKMNKYWGSAFFPPGPGKGVAAGPNRVIPPLDQWQCWEFMIQANSAPDKADGEQAMWVDGNLVGEFSDIRWRTDLDLKVN
ncbi:MAG: carbon-nitrogen hydrolase family protein, partial [Pirellula sp.]